MLPGAYVGVIRDGGGVSEGAFVSDADGRDPGGYEGVTT